MEARGAPKFAHGHAHPRHGANYSADPAHRSRTVDGLLPFLDHISELNADLRCKVSRWIPAGSRQDHETDYPIRHLPSLRLVEKELQRSQRLYRDSSLCH